MTAEEIADFLIKADGGHPSIYKEMRFPRSGESSSTMMSLARMLVDTFNTEAQTRKELVSEIKEKMDNYSNLRSALENLDEGVTKFYLVFELRRQHTRTLT